MRKGVIKHCCALKITDALDLQIYNPRRQGLWIISILSFHLIKKIVRIFCRLSDCVKFNSKCVCLR
jgi:hypothetical protein